MRRVVQKFGGTSVEDAAAMRRVAGVVRSTDAERIVVLSACAGVTNQLLRLGRSAEQGDEAGAYTSIDELLERHLRIARELLPDGGDTVTVRELEGLAGELRGLVHGIFLLGELTNRSLDMLASYGERMSSLIFHTLLARTGVSAELLDARTFMITDDQFTHATPLPGVLRERLERIVTPMLQTGTVAVTQGFIGATAGGITTTIGRGGSDHSAALIGAALGADEIQIWTDVDGILTADPTILPEARRIKVMSFMEASELAYFGARVLHPDTIRPAIELNIPVRVLNSRRPESAGTLIVTRTETPRQCVVKSIAYKEGITLVSIVSTRMFLAHGFLENVFSVFHKFRVVVHTVATSDVSASLTINDTIRLDEIVDELRKFATVTVTRGKAIVCVVGDNLRNSPGIAARVLHAIREVNINMISQGASEINISFVIDQHLVDGTVRLLHAEFFSTADQHPEVFD